MKEIRTEDAVGHVLCHDITQIIKDEKKGVLFKKGHIVREEDIPALLSVGKEHLYVWEKQEGMPPGTGDVPLTVFQSLPVDGIVIVSSPQDLVKMIVKKAYNMAEMMKIPVLGIVENYSYVKCPDCGKELKIFGESHIEEIAAELNVPVVGKMPIDMEYASKADSGAFDQIDNEYITKAVEVMPE